jgi:hypothetical protein
LILKVLYRYLFYIHNPKVFNLSGGYVLNFDQTHCHKWALLLLERQKKLTQATEEINNQNFEVAQKLSNEIFTGAYAGRNVDPGMAGSLLYHMAMVTKMESESRVLIEELKADSPQVSERLNEFYDAFASDATEYTQPLGINVNAKEAAFKPRLTTEQKIALFSELTANNKKLKAMLKAKDPQSANVLSQLFKDWANQIVQMRLVQEYETIKGLLVLDSLSKTLSFSTVEAAMERVQDKFGQETVNIALDVTLKVGLRREKLQSVMLSDHYIKFKMDAGKLDGDMTFMNCPIYGSHRYGQEKYGINPEVSALFCKHFCFAHAKAMLNTVLPLPIHALAT